MAKDLKKLERALEEAEKQREIQIHREKRLACREKYVRKAADRRRTHRLIQYGVAFEANDERLKVFSDSEIFTLVEKLFSIPKVRRVLDEAVTASSSVTGGEA